MKKLPALLLLALLLPDAAAALTGALRINTDTTGTNTRSSSITVTANTNLLAGSLTASNLTASTVVETDANKRLSSATETGSGAVVRSTTPAVTSPAITGSLRMQGSTVDANYQNLGVTDPTSNWLTLFPDAGGTVMISEPTDAPTNGQLPYYVTATTNYQHASFGLGITNSSGTISNNIVAGANVTITAGSNGQLSIASTGGGGSAPTGTMVNTGNNIVGGIPVASDTTDTNYVPSSVTINAGTNLLAGTVHGTNQVSGGRFLGTGTTADSRIDVPDDDGSAYAGFQAADTTTTAVNLIFPAAPFTGVPTFAVSSTTNWTISAALVQFSGPSTLRTITVPDANFTAARTDAANTFTGIQSITQIDLGSTGSSITEGGAGYLLVEGVEIVMPASTNILTNKGYDASATGNNLVFTDYKEFVYPARVDGAGCTIVTNSYTDNTWGLATYSGSADTNVNYALYRVGKVPYDLNSTNDVVLRGLGIRTAGTSTTAPTFTIAYYQPATSTPSMPSDFTACSGFVISTSITMTGAAANDVLYYDDITLTGTGAALTPGRDWILAIARGDNGNNDALSVTAGSLEFTRIK